MKKRVLYRFRNSQASVEHLLLVGLIILILIPTIMVFYSQSMYGNKREQQAQVTQAGNDIAGAINDMKRLGDTSWQTLTVTLPPSATKISASGNEIIISTKQGDQIFYTDPSYQVYAQDTELLKAHSGRNELKLRYSQGYVCLSSMKGECINSACVDQDGDGVKACEGDCDDADKFTYPSFTDEEGHTQVAAQEECDGKDNNCDGKIDEFFDKDNDGHFDELIEDCRNVHSQNELDCNDAATDPNAPNIYYGNTEQCDGIDNNCDENVDENLNQDCSVAHLGPCSIGTETCIAGVWVGCPQGQSENCLNGLDDNCNNVPDNQEPACAKRIIFWSSFDESGYDAVI
ncbi:MAG: putative metal-binding motif-containing protein, partial [Nanoarchaeota archaeon]